MPELAEVEYFRGRWNKGLGQKVLTVHTNDKKKVFRGTDVAALRRALTGATLVKSATHGKQMLFQFSKDAWIGVHLGMTGELRLEASDAPLLKHDHLVLRQAGHNLVFNDPRQFGRILFHQGKAEPEWWSKRPIEILSPKFTLALVQQFLIRRGRAPIKAVLLLQEGFPGIGNWMADEILWQSKIHPRRPAGKLTSEEVKNLHTKTKFVCRVAMRTVGKHYGDLPKTWLFDHRWEKGGKCPDDGTPLKRETIGGRTTCWCPGCQKLPKRV